MHPSNFGDGISLDNAFEHETFAIIFLANRWLLQESWCQSIDLSGWKWTQLVWFVQSHTFQLDKQTLNLTHAKNLSTMKKKSNSLKKPFIETSKVKLLVYLSWISSSGISSTTSTSAFQLDSMKKWELERIFKCERNAAILVSNWQSSLVERSIKKNGSKRTRDVKCWLTPFCALICLSFQKFYKCKKLWTP